MNTNTDVYNFICGYYAEHGYPPSATEISEALFLARNTVCYHIQILIDRGFLVSEVKDKRKRNGRFRPKGYKVVKIDG